VSVEVAFPRTSGSSVSLSRFPSEDEADTGAGADRREVQPGAREEALARALQLQAPGATAELFARYGQRVYRLLRGAVGPTAELPDLVQDVFLDVLRGIDQLRDPAALERWITRVAVLSARTHLRSRRRRAWLFFLPPEELPETPVDAADLTGAEALRAADRVLGRLSPDERLAFALRYIEDMRLTEVAAACEVSLATIKRRLLKAEERFREEARAEPALAEWISTRALGGER
jgi:RNA polymerase sigma-70 factor (ECF subfamily)